MFLGEKMFESLAYSAYSAYDSGYVIINEMIKIISKIKIVKIGKIGSFSESTSDMVNTIELWVYVLGRKSFESLAYSAFSAYSPYDYQVMRTM